MQAEASALPVPPSFFSDQLICVIFFFISATAFLADIISNSFQNCLEERKEGRKHTEYNIILLL